MRRSAIGYRVGNEHNPGDPFGRSELVIAGDGEARLDHHGRGSGHRAWTGRIDPAALDRLWIALELARFPVAPGDDITPGAAIRELRVDDQVVLIEWHTGAKLAGYRDAFGLLDAIVRQLSEDTVRATPPGPVIVSAISRVAVQP
ncbi:MAG TPA: hypothetical protein VLX92_30430 [Kofleriaceae bacterium]|nr:hypothetical protein [Kofleriaceae bacterium]